MGAFVGGSLKSREQDAPLHTNRKVRVEVTIGREAEANPVAAAFGVRLLELLHKHLSGNPSLSGDRSADYFGKALRGEPGKVLTVSRDIAQLATRPEREARAAITDLALLLLAAVRPADGTLVGRAIADFTREAAQVAAAYADKLDDGTLSASECDELQGELADVARESARLSVALEAHRRRLAS